MHRAVWAQKPLGGDEGEELKEPTKSVEKPMMPVSSDKVVQGKVVQSKVVQRAAVESGGQVESH